MKIELNKELFNVNSDDFVIHKDNNYTTLQLYPQLGIYERELGLIIDIICKCADNECVFINIGINHGGYLPIKLIPYFNSIYVLNNCNIAANLNNLKENCNIYDKDNKVKVIDDISSINLLLTDKTFKIVKLDNVIDENVLQCIDTSYTIILSYNDLVLSHHKRYNLTNSNLIIYIPNIVVDVFEEKFRYYLDFNILNYNNLINLCMIVKNAGDGFKEILEKNLPYIDQWTILDTGSTDNTIEIINDVLKSKKGIMYQEPFINFRESRNRCLELAGQSCKYTIMLDDTYILNGNVRNFLEYIRSDQFADSYNIFIKSGVNIYGSNRILKSDKQLKYIYKIHEIIQNDNNVVVQLPLNQIYINDIASEYMIQRTLSRKKHDLELLFETLEEYPNISRTLFYIAQTYCELKSWDEAFKYAMRRTEHPNTGYNEEITECYLICADIAHHIFQWDWDKCEELYLKCYNHDPLRPEALYCIGMQYKNLNNQKAFEYLKRGFDLGIPSHATSNLKYDIYERLLPSALTEICYLTKNYKIGEEVSRKYLSKNQNQQITLYNNIFQLLNNSDNTINKKHNRKDILCFVAYNSFNKWNGDSINKEGVGGSETFVIELSRNIAKMTNFDVYVFCNTDEECVINNVKYKSIGKYIKFINSHIVHTCIISRCAEYIPVTIENEVSNIYLIVHDLTPLGDIIPINDKLKGIFCMTSWHKQYFLNIFPMLTNKTFVFPNGINTEQYSNIHFKKKNSFIYSSFANRGLVNLLKMFPKIRERVPDATLNIFCDIKHPFVLSTIGNEELIIEKLLDNQKEYITNHGWVKKEILTEYFMKSEFWLYPCTFQETFCITALESAISNTLAITNDLAGLNYTVGDRGIIIPGNPTTEEWQNKAIDELCNIINNPEKKKELIDKNREWAKSNDWKILTQYFINNYIGTGKYFVNNFVKYYRPLEENIKYLCERFSHCEKVLEIGPGQQPFPLATHFVNQVDDKNFNNLFVVDITKDKLPFKDNEFDLVYCRHVLEDINNPEFVINELYRVAKIIYIETPSPLTESSRHIDDGSPHYRGYIHHQHLIWVNNNQLNILQKFPMIEYIKIPEYQQMLDDPFYWNTYFIWNKANGKPVINYFKYDIDYNLHTQYEMMIRKSIKECKKSITFYKNQINLTKGIIEYAGMLNWASIAHNGDKQIFESILDIFKDKKIHILEIGTYAGTSIINILKYLPRAVGTVIDLWENYDEADLLKSIKENNIEIIFANNLMISNMSDRITKFKGDSKDVLMQLLLNGNKYDFIYVDGSHKCLDCYSDMVIGWELLNVGGVLGIDDYLWNINDEDKLNFPYYGVNHFIERYKGMFQVLDIGYRVFLLKI